MGAAANADPNRTDTTREDRLVRGTVIGAYQRLLDASAYASASVATYALDG